MNSLRFPELSRRGLAHFFTLRQANSSQSGDLPDRLKAEGLPVAMVAAEQIHGAGVAKVGRAQAGEVIPQVDALISDENGLTLVVRVADCRAGTVRRWVLERSGQRVEVGCWGLEELSGAEEVFLTNARIGIKPVRSWRGRGLAAGKIGPNLSRQLF